jgi:Na+/proline symporter
VKPDQRAKYLVPLAMVVVPLVGFIAVTAIAMFGFVGMEESEGLAGLWVQIAPVIILTAAFMAAVFLVHDKIAAKKATGPKSQSGGSQGQG